MCKKKDILIYATCSCGNGKYVGSIIEHSVIACDETIEETKIILGKTALTKNFSNKKYFNKNRFNKMYFNKFLHFISLFINYRCIIDSF